jgi:hypothetical protein
MDPGAQIRSRLASTRDEIKMVFKVNGGIAGSARKYAVNRKAARPKNDSGQNNIINRQCGLGEIPKLNAAASDGCLDNR